MRVELTFAGEKDILLPTSYNYLIQSLIYQHIDDKLAEFLHGEGFAVNGRHFKLFTFSRLMGRIKHLTYENKFSIKSPFRLIISSPVENFVQSLAENLLRSSELVLNRTRIFLESINVHCNPPTSTEALVKMLSPVTVYSTLQTADGRKKTYYFSPFEKEFSKLIENNLLKKYKALYKQEAIGLGCSITPLKVCNTDQKIIDYKGTVIKGWLGTYKFTGSPELLKLAYDTGLGSKNSQGFGCFETIDRPKPNIEKCINR